MTRNSTLPKHNASPRYFALATLLTAIFGVIQHGPFVSADEAASDLFGDAERVVFLGDSITYSGQYIAYLESYVRAAQPDRKIEFLNIGLPSETVSGQSEPGHAGGRFPRPDLHERLDRVLLQSKPDLVVACYGMNCGIYHPHSHERFQAFQDGIVRLRSKAIAAGARIVHITPPTFDPEPIRERTLPAGEKEYRKTYVDYNEVLDLYSAWLLAQRGRGWTVIDAHGPMNAHLTAQRASNPEYKLAGDGVHMNETGHWLVAREVLRVLDAPDNILNCESANEMLKALDKSTEISDVIRRRQRIVSNVWLNQIGHLRPGMAGPKSADEVTKLTTELDEKLVELMK